MKCADAIAEFLARHVRHVFTISGGADLHIIHAIAARTDTKFICPQSEQGGGFAADAYARLNGMGCALATSGPGATNLTTPVLASYCDSVPMLYLTGNQTRERLDDYGTRGYGFQATRICEILAPITKLAHTVMDPKDVVSWLERAVKVAKEGRRGPVLIDIPDDVQRAEC